MKRIEELQRVEATRRATAQADGDTERGRTAEQQVLNKADGEASMLGNSSCDALLAGSSHEDTEIDDWANNSPVLQSVATRSREERSGGEKAATGSLANRMAKEDWPALALASEAVTTAAPKRSKRTPAAAVVGN